MIQFAKTRKHRILWITCVGASVLFLLLALIFALVTRDVSPTEIEVVGAESRGGAYHITVTQQETPLQINTSPNNATNQAIQFRIQSGQSFIYPISNIQSGNTALIVLRNNPTTGVPFFGQSAVIHVTAGDQIAIVNVQIELVPENVEFMVSLQRNGVNVSSLSLEDFRMNPNLYNVVAEFSVLGRSVFSTPNYLSMFIPQENNTDILLWTWQGLMVIPPEIVSGEYEFAVKLDFIRADLWETWFILRIV